MSDDDVQQSADAQAQANANRWAAEHKGPERVEGPEEPGHAPIEQTHGKVRALTPGSFERLRLHDQQTRAAGLPGVVHAASYVFAHAGVFRGSYSLKLLNQMDGIRCMSCAWPEPDEHRHAAEFCENGAKAIGHELDRKRIGAEFFAKYSVADLSQQTDHWLEQQGRFTQPMALRAGATHYAPIAWDDAFKLIADELNKLPSPDHAAFYTSGRASNEAAFCYQLFVRQFGTNNLPDCSNMCHESSGTALTATIGIGKGVVKLDDFEKTQLIVVIGQNPGTNHPRMLTALQKAKKRGAKIIAINPLREAGLLNFMNPQLPSGLVGIGTPLADLFLQVTINGDIAVLKGVMKIMLEREDVKRGSAFDWAFIAEHTHNVEPLLASIRATTWDAITQDSGLSREEIARAAEMIINSERIICTWAMGLTQQPNAVETIQEIVNVLLLRGSMGKPGAGACPVRGHSNVQGDRTMGIWERPRDVMLDKLKENFNFEPPRRHGFDSVQTAKAIHECKVNVFIALGGNFLSAMPDTVYLHEAFSKLNLSVRVGTKLNRSDLVVGKQALILPCVGRSELDRRASGEQFLTIENSMGVVEMSRGRFDPPSKECRSEVAIVCELAHKTLGGRTSVPWQQWSEDYDLIRDAIARTIPGCENYNQRVRHPGGFYLPNLVRDENKYVTDSGKANFTVNPIPPRDVRPGELIMMTIRSHDQFNTTIYALNDRYRGVHNERRVVFMNRDDMRDRGLADRAVVNITSHFKAQTRRAENFIVVPYDVPRGCCATYFPEGNVLVPIGSTSHKSNQPTSKYVRVTIDAQQ